MNDRLQELFDMQSSFMNMVHSEPFVEQQVNATQMKNMMLAIMLEAGEVLDEKQGGVQWKPWRKFRELDAFEQAKHKAYVKEELIDLFHFILEAMLLQGINADELMKEYKRKMQINIERQQHGY